MEAPVGQVGAEVLERVAPAESGDQVRALYLEPVTSQYELVSAPQWGNLVLFVVLLLAGLAVVGYMVRAVLRNPAKGAEAA